MDCLPFVVMLCLFTNLSMTLPTITSNSDLHPAAVPRHILQLEQTVSDLQVQSQAQEQKQAAILSSILSKLTSTSEEFSRTKADLNTLAKDYNSSLLEIVELKQWKATAETELQNCKHEHNLLASKQELNSMREDLKAVKSKLTTEIIPTQVNFTATLVTLEEDVSVTARNLFNISLSTGRLNTVVSYEAELTEYMTDLNNNDILKFDRITNNAGGGYDNTSGIFVAPISGSYLLWCHVTNADDKDSFYVNLVKGDSVIAKGYTPLYHGKTSITTVTHVSQGNKIWFSKRAGSVKIGGKGHSSFGGALLHIH